MVLKGQDEDRGVIKTEESEEEEVENVTAESRSQTGNDAENQQVPGEEEQPAKNSVNRPFVSAEDAEDDLGNRCVKRSVPLVPLTELFSDIYSHVSDTCSSFSCSINSQLLPFSQCMLQV